MLSRAKTAGTASVGLLHVGGRIVSTIVEDDTFLTAVTHPCRAAVTSIFVFRLN